jgi:hypothetical protein
MANGHEPCVYVPTAMTISIDLVPCVIVVAMESDDELIRSMAISLQCKLQ